MIYHMDDSDGRVAVLLPHGVLFRGGAEEAIRKYVHFKLYGGLQTCTVSFKSSPYLSSFSVSPL